MHRTPSVPPWLPPLAVRDLTHPPTQCRAKKKRLNIQESKQSVMTISAGSIEQRIEFSRHAANVNSEQVQMYDSGMLSTKSFPSRKRVFCDS